MSQRRRDDPDDFDGVRVRNNDELRATGPGGFGLTIKGRDTIILLLLTLALAGMVYFNYQQHRDIVEELSGVTYMMSLPVDERPRLAPPPKLQTRIERTRPAELPPR